jgi:hypothetical protein
MDIIIQEWLKRESAGVRRDSASCRFKIMTQITGGNTGVRMVIARSFLS